MDDIYKSKHSSNNKESKPNKYVNNLISRLLISIILFLSIISITNFKSEYRKLFKDIAINRNLSFNKITNMYNKYFGKVIPLKEDKEEMVFDEKITYKDIKEENNAYKLTVNKNYLVPIINSGLVVFIGEKDNLGNTVIIQGIDNIDYWYSNVTNLNVKLYDYVSKGSMLGNAIDDKITLTFIKDGKNLKYEEVIK